MLGMAGSSLKFLHPSSLISPTNFMEGKTSQAVYSAKGGGDAAVVAQSKVAAEDGPSTVIAKAFVRVPNRKREEKPVFECLEGEDGRK
jgi:hypothetical protein